MTASNRGSGARLLAVGLGVSVAAALVACGDSTDAVDPAPASAEDHGGDAGAEPGSGASGEADGDDDAAAGAGATPAPDDAGHDAAPLPACPAGMTDPTLALAANVTYPASHLAINLARYPFGSICVPMTKAGQGLHLEARAIRAACTVYDACETSLEVQCFDVTGKQLQGQVWSGENFLNGAASTSLFARMTFVAPRAGPVVCKAPFFNHDHGVAGGSIQLLAGSTFTASGPFDDPGTSPASGGGAHLTSAKPAAVLKLVAGWHMPAGATRADYLGDFQMTECHGVYPSGANDPSTECTFAESGADAKADYRAQAVEEHADGTSCHVTEGTTTTVSIDPRVHHKMAYTQVVATHTAGCANVWHFQVYARWLGGRSFMVRAAPYGQGMVRPL